MRRRGMMGATALALALAAGCGPALAGAKVGAPAPDFHATLFDGRKVALADYRGQVLVLNFWATWCGPCRTELPLLNSYEKIMKAHGLAVLAVASDDSATPYYLKPLAAKLDIPFVMSLRGGYRALDGYPTNYIIDRAGVLRYAKAGAFDLDTLNDLLVPLLREAPPDGAGPAPASAPTRPAATPAP